ncbi:class I SAM-dependent methyltransferase [Paenibacillus kobensis]|uniref:class I SAM-dependent methyltransferase n=1 Tax=Paenibacillus kobensis TaxID=59841 RepID=UPI003899338C
MKHGQLAPSLHAEQLNPNIAFGTTPFYVQRELTDWQPLTEERLGRTVELPRRAGLSSFGAGGANAHLIIEQYEPAAVPSADAGTGPQCIILSARSKESLREAAGKLAASAAGKLREQADGLITAVTSSFGAAMEEIRGFSSQRYAEDEAEIAVLSAGFEELEAYGRFRLYQSFQRMGLSAEGGESYAAAELRGMLGITLQYERLLEVLLDILVRAGLIRMDEGRVTFIRPVPEAAPERLVEHRDSMLRQYPEMAAYIRLLDACLDAYPDVLRGRQSFADVMFPEGSLALVEGIYRGNRLVDYYNRVTARAVAASAELRLQHDPNTKVRIMEVGAGTGGTSAFVLEALKPFADRVVYCYTDISAGLLQQAKQTFGRKYPFAEFKTYNAELAPSVQGFGSSEFDIIVATNVLHATKRIEGTLGRLKELLKPAGLIVINEMTSVVDFANLTFGLTSGWTLYEDQHLRHFNSPLLSAASWRAALHNSGFQEAQHIGIEGMGQHAASQHVILAEARPEDARQHLWLASAAYTLQEGREPMEERLACAAESTEMLLSMLNAYSEEGIMLPGMFSGAVSRQSVNRQQPANTPESIEAAASRWVTGGTVDWDKVSHSRLRQLIDLPAYPFDKARYWIPISSEKAGNILEPAAQPVAEEWTDEQEEQRTLDVIRMLEQGTINIEEADRLLEGIWNE